MGVATYVACALQGQGRERVAGLLDASGVFDVIAADPFSRAEWRHALEIAPSVKQDYYTLLSTRDVRGEAARRLDEDARFARCFVE